MWAHYGNNHSGFCVGYHVKDARHLYPVSYEADRIKMAATITHLLVNYYEFKEGTGKVDESDLDFYYYIIFHAATIVKHMSWCYEKEYRVTYPNKNEEDFGDLVPLAGLGLEVSKIYLRVKCDDNNRQRLCEISRTLACDVFEMYFDEYKPTFELSHRLMGI